MALNQLKLDGFGASKDNSFKIKLHTFDLDCKSLSALTNVGSSAVAVVAIFTTKGSVP